jgi:hypothetical protein
MVTVLRNGAIAVALLASTGLSILSTAPAHAMPLASPHFAAMTPVTSPHYPNIGYPGSCVWYALHERPDIPPVPVPYAYQIPHALAIKYPGYHQGNSAQLWALAVFAPGVQGANPTAGHIALVIAVAADRKTFQVAQMASPTAYVVSYGWDKVGAGVSFIY